MHLIKGTIYLLHSTFLSLSDEAFIAVTSGLCCCWPSYQGCHSAFLKQFFENEMTCPFSLFSSWRKKYLSGLFWINFNKTYIILRNPKIDLLYFVKISLKNLTFFETDYCQIWPFWFLGTWQPCLKCIQFELKRLLRTPCKWQMLWIQYPLVITHRFKSFTYFSISRVLYNLL
jgi:hypothetical protein